MMNLPQIWGDTCHGAPKLWLQDPESPKVTLVLGFAWPSPATDFYQPHSTFLTIYAIVKAMVNLDCTPALFISLLVVS